MWNAASTPSLRRAFLLSVAVVALLPHIAAAANAKPLTDRGLRSGGKVSTDKQPPATPSGLSLGGASASSLSLAWNASSDNVGVAGYELYLNGSKVGTTQTTSYS